MNGVIKFDGKIPKTLRVAAVRHAGRIAEITGRGVMYDDAYDVSYRAGWCSGSDPLGALHSDYATTVQGLVSRIKDARTCDCGDCLSEIKGGK